MGVCDLPVVSTVCDKAGDAAASLVTAPFDWLAEGMGNAAEWMFESVWSVFDSTTSVDITSDEYMKVYNILFGVAVFVMLGFFLLQVIGGMIRREPAALTRALTGLAKSVLGSFVAITLFGVIVAGFMWLIMKWHLYNQQHHGVELERLLEIARRDDLHG